MCQINACERAAKQSRLCEIPSLPLLVSPELRPRGEEREEEGSSTLGTVAPHWVPDQEASGCMLCDAK